MRTQQLLLLFVTLVLFSCTQNPKKNVGGFVLNGTIEGMKSGLIKIQDKKTKKDYSAKVVDGKFTLKGDFPEPNLISLFDEDKGYIGQVFAENATFTLTANVNDLRNTKIIGGSAHMDMLKFRELTRSIKEDSVYKKAQSDNYKPNISKERRAEVDKIMEAADKRRKAIELEFIKNNPKSYFSALLVVAHASGASVELKEKLIAMLNPSLYNETSIKEIRDKLAQEKNTEVSLEDFVGSASNVAYKVDNQFKGKELRDVVYLGVFPNNNICALTKDGRVQTISPTGVKVSEFKAEIKGGAASLAVDQNSNIYVMDVLVEIVKKKYRGRVMEQLNPVGVECTVYNVKGDKQNHYACADIITASGAKVMDGKLLLSDNRKGMIGIFDAKSGKLLSKINDMRPCCGILDFAVNDNKQLVVANLGAFRVQTFDLTGKSLMSFGKRGRELTSFHGCCNPVSVTSLKNGAVVTVEKEPTQVKIFSKEGAKLIAGIEELVKGCAYIPMIVDGKDNLYLASKEKGLVKCVSVKSL
ncbi:DUF4369 domain-containing protein [Marinifilum flexuosum]|uniref:Uncharacterized protein DUF4369 n=1 Tax=Marinifilum flexuosum TaxID=1117708 RepID=A0A419WWC1_9BACT|nr:DUF4369 domain-containing protein [Marinifilum flexuosum]RKD99772.1 uncharacterized protein DUF4369 [Marinifilum flexuosum]